VKLFGIVFGLLLQSTVYGAPIFGYGSSNAVIPAKDQELFFMGFEAGYEEFAHEKLSRSILSVEHVHDGSQLGAIRSAEKLLSQGVQMLLGFPTSHEALLVGQVASRKKIFTLVPAASHSDMASLGRYVYSTGEPMSSTVGQMLRFVLNRYPKKPGVVVVNPYAVYSTDQQKLFEELRKRPEYAGITFRVALLTPDMLLADEDIDYIRAERPGYLCFTQYASEARELMNQLMDNQIDLPIVTNSSWLTGDIEYVRRYLMTRKSPMYSAGVWIQGSAESRPFERVVRKKYGISPGPEISYGYDLGLIVATIFKDVKTAHLAPTSDNLLAAFQKRKCFEKTSGGTICFGPDGGHALRSVKFVKFTRSGFIPVKDLKSGTFF
jgi:ABC-type branched-subunit amino acid transport system substrate-binding protein